MYGYGNLIKQYTCLTCVHYTDMNIDKYCSMNFEQIVKLWLTDKTFPILYTYIYIIYIQVNLFSVIILYSFKKQIIIQSTTIYIKILSK